MMAIGFLWALAAPLLLLVPIALGARALAGTGWPRQRRLAASAGVVLLAVLAMWVPQRWRFAQLCEALGPPRIDSRAVADGFFLDDPTADSFGLRHLHEEGFAWLEVRSRRRPGGFTRYRRVGGAIEAEEVEAATAVHEVVATHASHPGGVSVQRTLVRERAGGRVLAQATMARFDGGLARPVLGVYGGAHCPDPAARDQNAAWQRAYHLARDTLRP